MFIMYSQNKSKLYYYKIFDASDIIVFSLKDWT